MKEWVDIAETEELERAISLAKGDGFHRTIAMSVSELRVPDTAVIFQKLLEISIFMGSFLIFKGQIFLT